MAPMTLPLTHEILDATEHLPIGATLVVPQVSWDDYEILLEELAERPHFRVSYDCGKLEIMSPSRDHEKYTRFFDDLVRAYADAFDLELEKLGQTTWKLKAVGKGVEADDCYFVGNPERSMGRTTGDLEADSPPDIAVEIDITRSSLRKFSIYAGLSIPELWTYDGENVKFYKLFEGQYIPVPESRFLPKLTGTMLAESINDSKARGQRTALHAFRRRVQSLKRKG